MSENENMLGGLQPHKGEEFLQMFYKGVEFTKDLMKENEKLRYKILELEDRIQVMDIMELVAEAI